VNSVIYSLHRRRNKAHRKKKEHKMSSEICDVVVGGVEMTVEGAAEYRALISAPFVLIDEDGTEIVPTPNQAAYLEALEWGVQILSGPDGYGKREAWYHASGRCGSLRIRRK